MNIEIFAGVLGWCSIINIGLLVLSAGIVVRFREKLTKMYAKIFGLDEKEVSKIYVSYLEHYEAAILMFNIVPYFALKLMG